MRKGSKMTDMSRKKMSKNHADVSGKNNPMFGRTGEKNPMFGKKHKAVSIKKMSEVKIGKKHKAATINLEKHNKYPLTEKEEIKYKGLRIGEKDGNR